MLLNRDPDLKITTELLETAARNGRFSVELMGMLLGRYPDCKITAELLETAVGNRSYSVKLVEMLSRSILARG